MAQSPEQKRKRATRRNRIAQDLGSNKYRQRIINPKRKGKYPDVNDWLEAADPETVPEGDYWLFGWEFVEEGEEDD